MFLPHSLLPLSPAAYIHLTRAYPGHQFIERALSAQRDQSSRVTLQPCSAHSCPSSLLQASPLPCLPAIGSIHGSPCHNSLNTPTCQTHPLCVLPNPCFQSFTYRLTPRVERVRFDFHQLDHPADVAHFYPCLVLHPRPDFERVRCERFSHHPSWRRSPTRWYRRDARDRPGLHGPSHLLREPVHHHSQWCTGCLGPDLLPIGGAKHGDGGSVYRAGPARVLYHESSW